MQIGQIVLRAVRALRPHPNNARTHSKKQIRRIADSIKRFGFTLPILGARASEQPHLRSVKQRSTPSYYFRSMQTFS
jgi:hypothetical protein